MTAFLLVPYAAAILCVLLAAARLLRRTRSFAGWCFVAGMVVFAVDAFLTGLVLRASQPDELIAWLRLSLVAKSLIPIVWLPFSLTYSRGNPREFLARWALPVGVLGLLPILLSAGFGDRLFDLVPAETGGGGAVRLTFGPAGTLLNVTLLVGIVLVLMNLEQTFRSSIGTMRWQIKYVVLGMVVIFGASLYVRSQSLLFRSPDISLWGVESAALLIGGLFLAVAYARTGLAEIDVYPSLAVVRSSLTVLIAGGYLVVVGVLGQLVRRFGGAEIFQFQALVVLLGLSGLAVLLLSDRARQRLHLFAVRHFSKAQHDSVQIWGAFSRRLAGVKDQDELCAASAKLVSEAFDALSVTVWVLDEEKDTLAAGASTARQPDGAGRESAPAASSAVAAGLRPKALPFDLDDVDESWAEEFRRLNAMAFVRGGHRLCVPLRAGAQCLGALVLADRVSGVVYTVEERELLTCIGDQMASALLNLRLSSEVARARELETLRTMSAFFVHDLKNAAASLNLMLKNLPVHFDDPAFRADALRAVGNTARRLDEMIARLSAFRERSAFVPVEADLNQLVTDALGGVTGMPDVELTTELQPLPGVLADRQQMQSVVTNLLLNARDAVGSGGRIHVRTERRQDRVVLSVADNGCGMSPAFVADSLFRPFQSTKKHGLGIGLVQCRAIVRAHGGGIHVESETGKGTTFFVSLPVKNR